VDSVSRVGSCERSNESLGYIIIGWEFLEYSSWITFWEGLCSVCLINCIHSPLNVKVLLFLCLSITRWRCVSARKVVRVARCRLWPYTELRVCLCTTLRHLHVLSASLSIGRYVRSTVTQNRLLRAACVEWIKWTDEGEVISVFPPSWFINHLTTFD
jgi:hypothetical protein